MSQPSKPAGASMLSRRTVFAGAGVAGAAAVAATVLPSATPPVAPQAAAQPDPAGGYQLTDHVKRYYATARV